MDVVSNNLFQSHIRTYSISTPTNNRKHQDSQYILDALISISPNNTNITEAPSEEFEETEEVPEETG